MDTDKEERFGIHAVRRGFITQDQLDLAIRIQQRESQETGKKRFIGRILVDQGLMSISQIDEILNALGKGPALA
jgi:hypothetical protein